MRGTWFLTVAAAALLSAAAPAFAQSADQAGDTTTTARLSVGATTSGELSPAGDKDWFRLSVRTGQRYTITLNSAGEGEGALGDPMLVVYDAGGTEIARNDDYESLNSRVTYVPSANGDVFVEARGFGDEATGAYALAVAATALPADNAGNDTDTRARVTPGRVVNGNLEYEGDTDWYRLDVRPGYSYRIRLNGGEGEGVLSDPMLILHGNSGDEIASNDDFEGLNSQLDYTPSERMTVFVEARGFNDSVTGTYTLSVEQAALPPDPQANNRQTRGRIAAGESVNGALDYAGDVDWFRITLAEGQAYRFTLNSGEGDSALSDPTLKLMSPEGEELASDDDGGGGLNSYLEFTAPTAGNYYLVAGAFNPEATGGYVLRAAEGDIPADNTTDASLSADGDYREGLLSPAGDRDWYRVNLEAGQSVRVGLVGAVEGGLGDPFLAIHGPDGAELVTDDDGGEGLNSWLEFTAPEAGAYYVEARGYLEEAEGNYALTVIAGEIPGQIDGAEMLTTGEGRTSFIAPGGDKDWFAIDLIEGRPYRFNLEGFGDASGLADPVITLFNAEGEQIATDDDGGSGVASYLSYTSVNGGPHYVQVSSFDEGAGGMYALRVSDTDVPGNTGTDENLVASTDGDDRVSRIEMNGDVDFYRVELAAGVRYVITVSGDSDTPLADPFLTILNEEGAQVTSDDDSGPGLDSRLVFTPETTSTYYIQASGLGGSIGGYKVAVVQQER